MFHVTSLLRLAHHLYLCAPELFNLGYGLLLACVPCLRGAGTALHAHELHSNKFCFFLGMQRKLCCFGCFMGENRGFLGYFGNIGMKIALVHTTTYTPNGYLHNIHAIAYAILHTCFERTPQNAYKHPF